MCISQLERQCPKFNLLKTLDVCEWILFGDRERKKKGNYSNENMKFGDEAKRKLKCLTQ